MPIKINLLAEQMAAEDAKRHDPVKQTIWVAAFLASLVFLYGLSLQLQLWALKNQAVRESTRLQKITPKYNEVKAVLLKSGEAQKKLQGLNALATNRFLWAPVMNALQFVNSENVRLTAMKAEQTYPESVVERTINAKTVKMTNYMANVVFTLDGMVSGPVVSWNQAEKYRASLASYSFFQTNLAKTNGVVMKDYAPKTIQLDPTADGGLGKTESVGEFKIICSYPFKNL